MVATALIGAVGTVAGGALSAYGSSQAAKQQAQAQEAAINEQQQMFNTVQSDLSPFMTAGAGALPSLTNALSNLMKYAGPGGTGGLSTIQNLAGLGTGGVGGIVSSLAQTPGYQFQQQMGQKAINNTLAAKGLAGPGGPLATASANFATGLAQSNWQNVLQGAIDSYNTGLAGLTAPVTGYQNLVGTGEQAAGALAGQATTTGSNIATNLGNIGAANAAGTLGVTNAGASALGGLTGYGQLVNLLNPGGLYGGAGTPTGGMSVGDFGYTGVNNPTRAGSLYAKGGRPPVGRPIIVGERGPEMLVLDRPGTIVPNHSVRRLVHSKNGRPAVRRAALDNAVKRLTRQGSPRHG